MRIAPHRLSIAFVCLLCATGATAQPTQPAAPVSTVPRVLRIGGTFRPSNGSPAAPVEGVTLSIYANEVGGTSLWQEIQNASVDGDGRYSVLLGSTLADGIPLELFASGEPRWLGVRFQRPGEGEQPRVRLASVPYALKAADADTLGGQPLSAFVLTNPAADSSPTVGASMSTGFKAPLPRISSGTPGYIGQFVNTTDLGNSVMFQNGTQIGIGTTVPSDYLTVLFNDITGAVTGYAVRNLGGGVSSYSGMLFYDQYGRLAQFQGFNNWSHEYRINNIATDVVGNLNGSINFMLGSNSKFQVRTDGDIDIAGDLRKGGLPFLHNGAHPTNAAFGINSLANDTSGFENVAIGWGALYSNIVGNGNTAVGNGALSSATGAGNIGLGDGSGSGLGSGNVNIDIGNAGMSTDSGVIRIGTTGTHTKFFLGGVEGVQTTLNAVPLLIDENGQLGTISSSRRFKEDIQDMDDVSSGLMHLRPVTYRYKQPYADGSKPIDYGLIAEEVAEIYPDLVVHDKDGQIQTVQYQKLTPMLLNELQKEHQHVAQQDERIQEQNREIQELKAKLTAMQALEIRLTALEARNPL